MLSHWINANLIINFTFCVLILTTLLICISPTSSETTSFVATTTTPIRTTPPRHGRKFYENDYINTKLAEILVLGWYITGSTPTARMWGAASLLLDGRVLFCGGVGGDGYVY